jgi:hypothetical protein
VMLSSSVMKAIRWKASSMTLRAVRVAISQ